MSAIDHQLHSVATHAASQFEEEEEPGVGLIDLLTWIGESKRLIAVVTLVVGLGAFGASYLMPNVFTARTTLLPPNSTQQSGSAQALAALGALGGLAGGLTPKTPDELYVALLKSDSLDRLLAERFDLMKRYNAPNFEALRKIIPQYVRVTSDKKSGILTVEVDDKDPKFAADLANAHATEITKVLGRLAVSEAAQRRMFFDQQLNQTKENLVKAEQSMRAMQEKTGVVALDRQAEALINNAAKMRAQITEREVQLRVLLTSATPQNPAVIKLNSELAGLRAELTRMESASGSMDGNPMDLPVGRLPEATMDYIRARREMKLQEALLESMVKQYEIAKLDEAKEGPVLQQVDVALPPDHKSKPARALILVGGLFAAFLLSSLFVCWRRYMALMRTLNPASAAQWRTLARAWRLR